MKSSFKTRTRKLFYYIYYVLGKLKIKNYTVQFPIDLIKNFHVETYMKKIRKQRNKQDENNVVAMKNTQTTKIYNRSRK